MENLFTSILYIGSNEVFFGNDNVIPISHTGSTSLFTNKTNFSLHNALDAYKHSPNLISVQNFVWILMFSLNFMHIIFVSRQQYNEVTSTRNGFIMVCSSFLEVFFSRDGQDDLALLALSSTWHDRLGHVSNVVVNKVLNSVSCKALSFYDFIVCTVYAIAKSHKLLFVSQHLTISKPFKLVYLDIWGSIPSLGNNFEYYFLLIINDAT